MIMILYHIYLHTIVISLKRHTITSQERFGCITLEWEVWFMKWRGRWQGTVLQII
ncbi:hypothetical protein NC653_024155 [Populus alba x Populus x berolinensis]|uniref:Uncharacterized protein n=1 Tax=Populus alba x Populus x berolinensis TaxID=444605 RepID=A0AAD6M8R0_9ROSI|nr:hypothetical protein NC653_024155 [Populus alba x Populus x berolinensis]